MNGTPAKIRISSEPSTTPTRKVSPNIPRWSATSTFVHTFSPATLATISLGYAHNWYPTDGVAASFGGFDPAKVLGMPSYIDTSGFLTPPSIWLFSAYGCNGFNGCVGGQAYSILKFASETGHLVGSVDHVMGRHEIKAGGELRRHRINFLQAGAPNGLFAFTSSGTASGTAGVGGDALAGLMIGYVDNAFTEYEIPPFTSTQSYQIGGFVQDNWRVTKKLTLNLGFRYDVETPRTERYNQMSYFDPSAQSPISVPGLNLHGAVEYVGVDGNPRTEFNTYWGEVGPRFGFAYQLFRRTTLRGGYGMYYDPSDLGVVGNAVSGGFLGYDAVTTGVNNVPSEPWLPLEFLRNPFPFGIQTAVGNRDGASTLLGQALTNIPIRNLNQTPQEQSWSFGIQHQLPWSVLVDAEYIGRKGTHLYAMGYADQFDALPANVADAFRADPSFYLAQVPNPFQGLLPNSPGSVRRHHSQVETVRSLSPIQQWNRFRNQQQLCALGQFDLQRGSTPHREALLGRSRVPLLIHVSRRASTIPRWDPAAIRF